MLKYISNKLRDLFHANVRLKRDEAAELAARLGNNVLELVDNMPTLPDTATRALALADDPSTKFTDFARIIEGDAAIATGLLRVANSVFFSGGAPAVKLPQAVVRLGMFQCKNLIVSISMKSLVWQMVGEEKEPCEMLWDHGYVTGVLCRQMNRAYRLMFDGEEFSAGLLHDLGRILLLLADRECFERAGAMDFFEEPGLLERERAAIGIDHCALGSWFGEHSKLPESLIRAMRFHHAIDGTDPNAREVGDGLVAECASIQRNPLNAGAFSYENGDRLVALVATADHMANHLQRGEPIEVYRAEDNAGLAHLWAAWPEARKERFLGEIPTLMNEALQAALGEQAAA